MPIIEERLADIEADIVQRVEPILAMVVTDDSVKAAKKTRAEFNKEFAELEEQRKAIKKAVSEPYEAFELAYKQYTAKYKEVDEILKNRINDVENALKNNRRKELAEYIEELLEVYSIDFLTVDMCMPNITLSASEKSLRDQARLFVEAKYGDKKAAEASGIEILTEWKTCLDLAKAIEAVESRKKRIAEETAKQEAQKAQQEAQVQAVAKVNAALPVPQVIEDDPVITASFTITAVKSKLLKLKEFLEKEGIEWK